MQTQHKWLDQVKQSLDQSVEQLDPASVTRLRAIRRQALEEGAAARRAPWFMPATQMTAAAAALALLIWSGSLWWQVDLPVDADLELMATIDDLELYEDLDFYQWLAAQQANAG